MLQKLWLTFAQVATLGLGLLLVVETLRPDLLPLRPGPASGSRPEVQARASAREAVGGAISYSTAARRAMPAVVNIFTSKEVKKRRPPFMDDPVFRRFFGDAGEADTQRSSSLGSGVIVRPDGYILTNNHVVRTADEIQVALNDGRQARAKIVGLDPESDLAVLRVDMNSLPAISFGQSERLAVGDVVLAIGNPFGVGQTVTMGIVSALGRSHLGINTFEDFVQTDAAINPGNSGGALVDTAGNLIGVNTAIFSQSGGNLGIGFAIPAHLARKVMDEIIQTGGVTRGWIGVEVQDLTSELAESFKLPALHGVLIAGVVKGGPADRAGVRAGDILIGIGSKAVGDSSAMLNLVAGSPPGKATTLKLMRNNAELIVTVAVGKRPKAKPGGDADEDN